MAIVRMKKLNLLAARSQKNDLLRDLMLLGCVQLREQDNVLDDPAVAFSVTREESDTADWRAKRTLIGDSLKLLDKYAPIKTPLLAPMPELRESDFMDDSDVETAVQSAKEIIFLDERIKNYNSEETRQSLLVEALTPWKSLDLPLEMNGTKHVAMVLGTVPAAVDMGKLYSSLSAALEESQIIEISNDDDLHYFSAFFLRGNEDSAMNVLRSFGFALPAFGPLKGTAAKNISELEESLEYLRRSRDNCNAKILEFALQRDMLRACFDRMETQVHKAEASETLLKTETAISLEGWVSAPQEDKLRQMLEGYICAYELLDPDEGEYPEVPVKLQNNKFTDGLNMVTNMYSLPQYGTVDPNPAMAPFFILFYGVMMADIGYGLLMVLASLIVMKKKKPNGGLKHFCELMLECGIATFIMGIVTGGCFGDAPLQIAKLINPETTFKGLPALFDPLQDTVMVLIGAMVIGLVQIIVGMIINFVQTTKRGHFWDALMDQGSWWLVFAGIGVGALTGSWWVAIAGVAALICTQGRSKPTIGGKIIGGIASLYNITSYVGDILSYSRLMALMLAGSVIAQVFNTLGAMPGNIYIFIPIFLLGNALNFALNLLGCYVHDLRLQCLEYFGKFYSDGGKPFKPLSIKTKYYKIVK